MTTLLAAAPALGLGGTITAGFVMLAAGVAKKRLRWQQRMCTVCGHPQGTCTCRWL